ncbi:hypothetical protein M8J76_003790 [Diaphorina citri]|nr:hypothetical protein M8J76_003790 [Diaphorina citri]
MEDHNDIRRTLPNIWDGNQTNIVNIIRNKWNIVDYTELEIHTVCGILETNAFDVSHNGSKARALYSSSFLFSHNCVPNTTHTNDHNYHFKIRTSVPVPRNQTLTLTYTYIIEGTLKRREHIKASKFFDCFCARCKDPSELKTWTSALVCPQCNEATVISTNPLDGDAAWTCRKSSCDFYLSAESVHKLLNK